ncbi:MAG: DNA polymerase I [Candidatus Saccharibacteria bacterium]|nr:DNA polymerase I [Candidatus Saccharibacteria bacterium]
MLQIIDPHVHVFALKKGLSNIELYSPKSFTAKYGLEPEQFLDLKALKGDSSDNIPGVPGIGEKTAVALLQDHKTLDGVYENIDLIKESVRKKLVAGKDLAYLSKKIGALWTDAPIKLDLKNLDVKNCDPHKIRESLQKFEFRTLVRQLPEAMQVLEHHEVDLSDANNKPLKHIVIQSDKALDKIAGIESESVLVHARCAGKHGRDPKFLLLSFDGKTVYVIDVDKVSADKLKTVLAALLPAMKLVGYDVKSFIKACYSIGVQLHNVGHDVLVGAFLINSLRREQTLTELASADLGYEGSSLEEMPNEDLVTRSGEVLSIINELYKQQAKDLESLPKVKKLAHDIEWPVIPVLAAMEYEGIELDTKYLKEMNDELDDMISDLQQQIYGYADEEFNIGSPAQLSEILFNKLKLPTQGIKKGKTSYSTAASELDKLRGQHEIIDLITHYREVTKLKNTYVDTLPEMVDENSRLHTTFNLTIAQTGRLSSTDPNLQNIPTRTDLGRRIRTAFVAGKGKVLISADYSQFELRLAAYLANDTELIEMFNGGADIHTATAAQVYNRQPDEVTKSMRRDAKVINFGVLYGMSPHGLSIATGMTRDAAQHFIEKYFELRKPLLEYMNHLKEKAREDGYVETLFGRRRPMPDIHSSNFAVRQAAERAAINMPIQGTEADLMKMAMIEVQKKLEGTPCKQLLQIHDSILIECPESEAEGMADMLKTTMESIHTLPVKLDVDVVTGKNWGEL